MADAATGPGTCRQTNARQLSVRKKLAFALIPAFLLCASGEVAVRIHRGRLFTGASARLHALDLRGGNYKAEYHATLGWKPRDHFSYTGWSKTVTLGSDGIRLNRPNTAAQSGGLLAIGDSFTFGDEVSDNETWPAQLEQKLKRRVINAGVFGFGFDQSVLRAEMLVPKYTPKLLMMSLIPDDIHRCEMSFRYGEKPYFDVASTRLAIRNAPVPYAPPRPSCSWFVRAAGYSQLADAIFKRLAPRWWYGGEHPIVIEHDDGAQVACLLLERLQALCARHDSKSVLIVQGLSRHKKERDDVRVLIEHARQIGIPVLDLIPVLQAELDRHPKLKSTWFARRGHHTSEGNNWVADRIIEFLQENDLLPETSVVPNERR